ncbi:MAG: FRG domain-containing protein [Gemmatimonadota bacterium]
MPVKEIRANSWTELNELLYEGSFRREIGRDRSPYVFRGVTDARSDLSTTLYRLGGDFAQMENHLLRNFRKYARRTAVEHDSPWNWLAVAQHHGLPTRLLDWTFSPLVAMHFATQDPARSGVDGAIWAIDFVRVHELLPEGLREMLEEEGSQVFTVEMLECAAASLEEFGGLAPDDFLLFVEPPSLDDRIVNQFALFSVMSRATGSLDAWLEEHPELCHRVVIPAELKREVRDKLDQANVTERVLFPGLDGLARWLKRYYTPRDCYAPQEEDEERRTPEREAMSGDEGGR